MRPPMGLAVAVRSRTNIDASRKLNLHVFRVEHRNLVDVQGNSSFSRNLLSRAANAQTRHEDAIHTLQVFQRFVDLAEVNDLFEINLLEIKELLNSALRVGADFLGHEIRDHVDLNADFDIEVIMTLDLNEGRQHALVFKISEQIFFQGVGRFFAAAGGRDVELDDVPVGRFGSRF